MYYVFNIIRSVYCDSNHTHTPTNAHSLYKIIYHSQINFPTCFSDKSPPQGYMIQQNIKQIHEICIYIAENKMLKITVHIKTKMWILLIR